MTPDVASIMELLKGSLASLEKRLLGKKDPRSVVPNSFCRDLALSPSDGPSQQTPPALSGAPTGHPGGPPDYLCPWPCPSWG